MLAENEIGTNIAESLPPRPRGLIAPASSAVR